MLQRTPLWLNNEPSEPAIFEEENTGVDPEGIPIESNGPGVWFLLTVLIRRHKSSACLGLFPRLYILVCTVKKIKKINPQEKRKKSYMVFLAKK